MSVLAVDKNLEAFDVQAKYELVCQLQSDLNFTINWALFFYSTTVFSWASILCNLVWALKLFSHPQNFLVR